MMVSRSYCAPLLYNYLHITRFLYKQCFFFGQGAQVQAQMLLSEIQIFLNLGLPYLTKRYLKILLGRVQSFKEGVSVLPFNFFLF